MAIKERIVEPLTDNKEKARQAQRASKRPAQGTGPSRAKAPRSGGDSENKRGASMPKGGGAASSGRGRH